MIVLLDNGLRTKGEHSYQLLTSVSDALAARGLASKIYGYRRLRADVERKTGAVRHFRDHLYVGRLPGPAEALRHAPHIVASLVKRAPLQSEGRTAEVSNRRYGEDLAALPPDVWEPDNIVVFPGLTQNQIVGLSRFLAGRGGSQAKIICQLMMDVGWTPWGATATHGEALYRAAFERLRPYAASLRYTAENAVMAAAYAKTFGVDVGVLPVPLGGGGQRRETRGRPRFGFFGYSKTEKGFHLLPAAIRLCRAGGLDADFVVQIQHSGWEPDTVRADAALRTLADVTLIEGEMDSETYRAVTNDVDVTLLPYDPQRFGFRGSGLLTEAVAAGRPVIASQGLYAATKIADGSAAGEIFAPYTAAALATAVRAMAGRLEAAKAQAASLAEAFARQHSGQAYVDVLLSL